MHLQSVALHGFKSFADKTVLTLRPGVTAIVGPNGCGKSNVADAIRWALGEQSPKTLRGQRMEDVIFHGSVSRRPLGLAEVSLVFTNDGDLAVPWSEVMVGRRLYRDGESEYLLNRTACRLKDIHDLFLGTGVNPKAYALMEQERLAHLLTARPIDRRVFIEEAAGITRYKQQRAETMAKLEATRQNLLRVRDVMDEVRRQLAALERQARRAQQYKALVAERRTLELALMAAEHRALLDEEAALAARRASEERIAEGLRARVAALGAEQELARADTLEAEHRLDDRRQALQKVELELERLLERAEQLRHQAVELGAETARLGAERQALATRLEALAAERQAKAALVTTLRAEHEARRGVVAAEEARLEETRARLRARREEVEALRAEQVRTAGWRTELGQLVGGLVERAEQISRRIERLRGEQAAARAEDAGFGEAHRGLAARLEALGGRLGESAALVARLEAKARELEVERAAAGDRVEQARLSVASRQSSLEALEALEAQREGYGAGVKAVFGAAQGEPPRLSGIVGTVADLLEVPREMERAVEAALGDRLGWVVVETFGDAKAALGYLGARGDGPATFLPLELLNGGPGYRSPEGDGVIGPADALVRSPYRALLEHLLGSVVVVRDLPAAERLWRQNGAAASYVTVEGELLTPPGALGGGRAASPGSSSLLARRRLIRDLHAEVAGLRRALEEGQDRLRALDAELARFGAERAEARDRRERDEAERLALAKDHEQLGRELERADLFATALGTERAQLEAEAATVARELEARRGELAAAEGEARRLDETIVTHLRAIEEEAAGEERLTQGVLTAQVACTALAERIQAALTEQGRLAEAECEADERLRQGADRLEALAARRAEIERELERTEERARLLVGERGEAERAVGAAQAAAQDHARRVQELGEAVRAVEADLARVTSALHDLALRSAQVEVRRKDLEAEAGRQFGVEVEALRQAHDPARDLEAARARVEELAQKIAALEPVNLIADEEYRALEERHAFLRSQHDDLTASMKDLDRALKGMTRTAQERFVQAFEAINANFQALFARLFEGGRAGLCLVESEDPLEAGIELQAQPRGKRLQAVSLLSGGEKALTGLALLFSIFYFRPSPFCLLDEVDAPLDDANIDRFVRVLRELSAQTQFIVITHNRKTMEAADVLYGITMDEPGLSRLVSVTLKD
ncbi:MAG: chromosome segregation protein SMC [Candidatus Rokubacteria bacterium]|nr:chromosome segregation protein SMC [Candidatus Rokubacteria bacterium]